MKMLSQVQTLVEINGWSIARAQGFVDGELSRRRGSAPSSYARVGIDDYSLGFRAGFYERGEPRDGDKGLMSTAAAVATREAPVQTTALHKTFEEVLLDGAT
jgi:hypothetical protein